MKRRSPRTSSTSPPNSTLDIVEFQALLKGPNRTFRDYKNAMAMIDLGARVLRAVGVEKRIVR